MSPLDAKRCVPRRSSLRNRPNSASWRCTADAVSSAELTSVTVIARTAMQADALATSVSVMGSEKGLELIESVPDVEAIVIPSGAQIEFIKTTGAERFISK